MNSNNPSQVAAPDPSAASTPIPKTADVSAGDHEALGDGLGGPPVAAPEVKHKRKRQKNNSNTPSEASKAPEAKKFKSGTKQKAVDGPYEEFDPRNPFVGDFVTPPKAKVADQSDYKNWPVYDGPLHKLPPSNVRLSNRVLFELLWGQKKAKEAIDSFKVKLKADKNAVSKEELVRHLHRQASQRTYEDLVESYPADISYQGICSGRRPCGDPIQYPGTDKIAMISGCLLIGEMYMKKDHDYSKKWITADRRAEEGLSKLLASIQPSTTTFMSKSRLRDEETRGEQLENFRGLTLPPQIKLPDADGNEFRPGQRRKGLLVYDMDARRIMPSSFSPVVPPRTVLGASATTGSSKKLKDLERELAAEREAHRTTKKALLATKKELSDLAFKLEEERLSVPIAATTTQSEEEEDGGLAVGEVQTIGVKALLSIFQVFTHFLADANNFILDAMSRNRNQLWRVPNKLQAYLATTIRHGKHVSDQGVVAILGLRKGAEVPSTVQQLLQNEFRKAEVAKITEKKVDIEDLWVHGVRVNEDGMEAGAV